VYAAASRPNQLRPLKVTGRSINAYWGTNVQTPASGIPNPGFACPPNTDNGTCVFAQQPNNAFGDVRPFSLRGPGYEQVDMSVEKSFPVWREQRFDFRADFFNAFNIADYQSPDSTVSDANFGQITNTNSAERHIQLSLKYAF
jgi:hypothetical protein